MGKNLIKALVIGVLAALALTLYDVFKGQDFNLITFGTYTLMIMVLDVFLSISRKKMQDVADDQIKDLKNQNKN